MTTENEDPCQGDPENVELKNELRELRDLCRERAENAYTGQDDGFGAGGSGAFHVVSDEIESILEGDRDE